MGTGRDDWAIMGVAKGPITPPAAAEEGCPALAVAMVAVRDAASGHAHGKDEGHLRPAVSSRVRLSRRALGASVGELLPATVRGRTQGGLALAAVAGGEPARARTTAERRGEPARGSTRLGRRRRMNRRWSGRRRRS